MIIFIPCSFPQLFPDKFLLLFLLTYLLIIYNDHLQWSPGDIPSVSP